MGLFTHAEQILVDHIELLGGIVVGIDVEARELGENGFPFLGEMHIFGEEFVKTIGAVPVTELHSTLFACLVFRVGDVIVHFVADITVLFVHGEGDALAQFLVFQVFLPFRRDASP